MSGFLPTVPCPPLCGTRPLCRLPLLFCGVTLVPAVPLPWRSWGPRRSWGLWLRFWVRSSSFAPGTWAVPHGGLFSRSSRPHIFFAPGSLLSHACPPLRSCRSHPLSLRVSPLVQHVACALQATSLGSESEPPFLSSAEGNFIFSVESFSFQFYLVCLVLSLSPWDVADFSSWVPGRQGPWAQQARTGSGVGLGREDRSRAWVSPSWRLLCPSASAEGGSISGPGLVSLCPRCLWYPWLSPTWPASSR